MIRRVALFDIDGTILTTNGRAVQAMMLALSDVYGFQPRHDGYLMDGKTELLIVRELLGAAGCPPGAVEAGMSRFWGRYAETLRECIHSSATTVYPGVLQLIERLGHRSEIGMGLLTGNCPAAAEIKLEAAGLAGRFSFGAFGDRHEARQELAGIAMRMAIEQFGDQLGARDFWVLGDTPNDILCGRPFGMKTIAVATGRYDEAALAAHGPDHLFADFSDSGAVEAAIIAG